MSSLPLHPEEVPDRPGTVRWVVPAGRTPFAGDVAEAPGDLGVLLGEGTLCCVHLEPAAVLTCTDPETWSRIGARVRRAVATAVGADGWSPKGEARTDDEALREIAEQAVAGAPGDYVRSHGGEIEVLDARDGVVQVRLGGACSRCPAVAYTLSRHVTHAIRERYPELVEVRHT